MTTPTHDKIRISRRIGRRTRFSLTVLLVWLTALMVACGSTGSSQEAEEGGSDDAAVAASAEGSDKNEDKKGDESKEKKKR